MNQYAAGTPAAGQGGDGLVGSLMGAVGGMLGGKTAGNLAGIATLLGQVKLDAGQMGSLGTLFFEFVKSEAGQQLAQRIMGGLGDFLENKAA